jgi:hypothetical protein
MLWCVAAPCRFGCHNICYISLYNLCVFTNDWDEHTFQHLIPVHITTSLNASKKQAKITTEASYLHPPRTSRSWFAGTRSACRHARPTLIFNICDMNINIYVDICNNCNYTHVLHVSKSNKLYYAQGAFRPILVGNKGGPTGKILASM